MTWSRTLNIDLETFCETPLRDGVYRYAETVEVLLFAYAFGDDGPIKVHDLTEDPLLPAELDEALRDPTVEVVAQNSMFDRTVLREALGYAPDIERWFDTMVAAYCHGLPGGLDALCDILNIPVDERKHKAGKDLVKLFCQPRPKNSALRRATKHTHPVEWARFKDYAGSDIASMRAIRRALPKWNYPGVELPRWHLDQRINDRGFLVDLDLAENAVRACEAAKNRLARRTQDLTGDEVMRATQRDALLKHLLEWYGVHLPDLRADTLERRLEDESLPWAVKELIAIRLQASVASTAKYKSLLKAVSSDGRLRGTLQFSGASRTGRWAGRVFQPQNLPRPTMKQAQIEEGIAAIKAGTEDIVIDDVMTVASNALRGVLVAAPGCKLVVSDLSNIEGRVLAWLAGEGWKLQAFRDFDLGIGHDLYHITAGNILGKDPGKVTKDERQAAGKVPELACGYQGAAGAFKSMAALYGLDLPEARVREIVRAWRDTNPNIVSLWYESDNAMRTAIGRPGQTIDCRKLKFRRDGAWLRILLPSGKRSLCYPAPRIEDDKITYMGMCPYTKQWKRLTTYGGKIVENVTQATACEVLKDAMPNIRAAGYDTVLTVHDEVITETPDVGGDNGFTAKGLSKLLAANPPWARDLPLAAGGFETYRYRKD